MEEKEWNYCIQMIFSLIMAVSVSASCSLGYQESIGRLLLSIHDVAIPDCKPGFSPSPTTGNPDYQLLNCTMTVNGLEFYKYPRCPLPHTIPIPAPWSDREGSFYWNAPIARGNDCRYIGCKKFTGGLLAQGDVSDGL
jgi:hypothetical protein